MCGGRASRIDLFRTTTRSGSYATGSLRAFDGRKLTVMTAPDPRVKAAAPSCGGISDRDNRSPLFRPHWETMSAFERSLYRSYSSARRMIFMDASRFTECRARDTERRMACHVRALITIIRTLPRRKSPHCYGSTSI